MVCWIARPASLSPSSCAISARSSPSPASMLPSSRRAISRRHNGRRSWPASAALVSLARPIYSAQRGRETTVRGESAASGCIARLRRACKLRGDVAPKYRWTDMVEAALKIGPDFTADIGPALAESEIFAEIGAGCRIDHAFEQRKAVRASRQCVMRVLAKKLQRRIVRMRAHLLKNVAADHQKAGPGIAHPREAVDDGDMIGIVDLEHVVERSRRHVRPSDRKGTLRLFPVDALDWIHAGDDIRSGLDQAEYLVGRKADVGVDEQKMGRGGIVENRRHQVGAGACDQRIAIAKLDLEPNVRQRPHRALQCEDGIDVKGGNLAAETGRGHHEVNLLGHEALPRLVPTLGGTPGRNRHQSVNRRG